MNRHLSPSLTKHKKHKKITTYDDGNPDPGFGQEQQYGRVNRLIVEGFSNQATIKITRHFNKNILCNSILPTFICNLYEARQKIEDSKRVRRVQISHDSVSKVPNE